MATPPSINCDTIPERKALLERLGGLPETIVQNAEWLYMLAEDTRQSLAIEGHFASEDELAAALSGGKTDLEIANYFRAAQTVYDQALQYYRDKTTPPLDLPTIRHIHSELFRGLDRQRGEFRHTAIVIRGAKVTPPEFDVDEYLRSASRVMLHALTTQPILPALARCHALFESIHPFSDGNGRVGRILLNYLAVSQGYPPIVIKGLEPEQRTRYYTALEAADVGFHAGFPLPVQEALHTQLEEGDFGPLAALLCEGVLPRLDHLILLSQETRGPLMDLAGVAEQLGVSEAALRQRLHRGHLIAEKRGKKLFSHPELVF